MYKNYILKILVLVYGELIHKSIAENLSLPDGFLIGAATSSYQVEGAWNVSCKFYFKITLKEQYARKTQLNLSFIFTEFSRQS